MRQHARRKVIDRAQLSELRLELRTRGETLVHCHGCFDIVHPGHIHHLRFASEQGDRLIVSVTPDRFVNKGPDRPMFSEQLRLDSLAALEFIDWVVLNDEPTAVGMLDSVQPDVFIKGAEYQHNRDPRFLDERAAVERYNGRVVFSDDEVVFSSSAIIESIRSASQADRPETSLCSLAAHHDLSSLRLGGLLGNANGKRVLVLSESILDVYAHCAMPEIAQEHPMLSLHPDREEFFDGGGAVIAKHLASMGLDVTLCTPIGTDQESLNLVARLERAGVQVNPIETDQPLPTKLRYLVDCEKMMKIDSRVRYAIEPSYADVLISQVEESEPFDAMVIADFGLGLFAHQLASRVITGVRDRVGMILGDVSGRRAQLSEMRGADVLCPCEVELRQMLDGRETPLPDLAARVVEETDTQTLCVTRAGDGLMVFDRHLGVFAMPALCDQPRDVLGCGDALLSAMTAALLGGADRVQAAYIGSLAAAIEGETLGNLPVASCELLNRARVVHASLIDVAPPVLPGVQVEPDPIVGTVHSD